LLEIKVIHIKNQSREAAIPTQAARKVLNVFLKPRRDAGIGERPGRTLVKNPSFKR
jgi:hypothetical protein